MKRKMWWLKRYSTPHLCARYLMLFCTLGFVLLPTSYVWANPAGEQVVGGAATFQREGNTLTVNQATDRLAVNWQSFNIGAGESTHFNMPSSTSAALNRVIGGNPSSIYGSLSANGILYLINPSGILVGPGGTVNAASFMASTLDVSTEQFMNAKNGAGMNFYGSSGESIINQGNITAEKGDVFLIAQKVENRGTINAANGTAGMVGSGQSTDVMVHEVGGKGFAIRVAQLQGEAATGSNRDLPDGEELLNEGSINAAQAELNASGNVYALAIRNSGTIRAKAVVANADGTVRLDGGLGDVINTGRMYAKNAGDDATAAGGKIEVVGQNITASPESIITASGGVLGGDGGKVKIDSQDTTIVQGKVDVTAPSAGAKGGKVQLLGERVGLFDGAKVDASGGAGGGTVLVGGDYLGGQTPKPELKDLAKQEAEPVKNAKATVMADTAEIKADATVNGDGGKIILWSDEYTGFYGELFARGGATGGNGGFIETSSKDNLQAFGSALASSVTGQGGLWLLDPANVNIAGATANGAFDNNNPNTFTPTAIAATVLNTTINSSLDAGVSVIITTAFGAGTDPGNITVSSAITKTAGNSATLSLLADNDIITAAGITSTVGALAVEMVAGANGSITLGAGAITSNGGYVSLSAGAGIIFNAASAVVTTSGGAFVADADSNADGAGKFTIGNFAATLVDTRAGLNPAGSITITSGEIAIGGAAGGAINAGGANIQLINSVAGNSMNVATLPIGPYDISQTTLNNISTSGLLVIGGADQTGTIRVGSPDFVTGALPYGIQFGASATTPINLANDILTTGKILNLFGAVTLSPSSGTSITLNTASGVAAGADILFLGASTLDSDSLGSGQPRALTINAGTAGRLFLPTSIGATTSLGSLGLTAGGGILLQGATTISTLKAGQGSPTGNITLNSSILPTVSGTGTRTLAITTQNGGDVSFQGVGTSVNPIDGLTVSSGTGTTTLSGSVFTAGGAVSLGSAVSLATGAITIDTTRLGNTAGAGISFLQSLSGAQNLTLLAGTGGALAFGGAVSGLTQFNVSSGGSFTVDNGSTFQVAGNITIAPQVVTNGNDISMSTTVGSNGNITLQSGLITNPAGTFGQGRTVTLSAGGTGTLTIAGEVDASGLSGTFVIPGTNPITVATVGFDGGTVSLTGATVTTGSILVNGDADQTGNSRGGNGGSITINSTGAKTIGSISAQGALGSPAGRGGSVTLAGSGANILNGSIILDGGNGQAAGDLGAGAGSLSFTGGGGIILNNGISANGGNGNGSGGGGSAGVLTLPDLTIGGANVAITALGGDNGTGTGRGADGNLTFGAVTGAVAGANSLQLDVGAGTVTFNGAVGAIELGQITIQNALNVTFSLTLDANKFVQNASVPQGGIYADDNQDGSTTFGGLVTLSGTGTVLDLTGYNFTFNTHPTFGGGVAASTGSVNGIINGVFAVNDAGFSIGGDLSLEGGAVTGANPRVDLNFAGTAISTSSGLLTFGTAANPVNVRLLQDTILSTGLVGGQMVFEGLVDSDATPRNLTLNSGGSVTLNGLVGSLNPLADLTTDAGGSLLLAAVGSRTTPSISATGTLTFNDQVDLQSDTVLQADALTLAATGLIDGANDLLVLLSTGALTFNGQVGRDTSLTSFRVEGGSGVTFNFVGTQANLSVATTGNQYYQTAVTLGQNTILNAGSMDFLSTVNGAMSFVLDSAGAINLYGRVGNTGTALTQFQTSGGGILNLLATGADGSNPTIKTTGAQLFGSSLVLGEDTFLTSTTSGDFIFLNAIDSRQANQPRNLTVQGAERVVLESAAGGAVRLGGVSLTAGTDVTVLGGIDTFGAIISITAGNGVTTGSVVISGDITTAVADQLGGAIDLNADVEVILNGGTINTFGGNVTIDAAAFIQEATTITTAGGDLNDGTVDFSSTLNGDSLLSLNSGTALATFTGAVGGTNPFGMTVSSAGGIDFTGDVTLGGNFNLSSEGTGVKFNGALNGDHSVTINSILGDISLGTVGDVIPIAGFSTSSGSGTITLNGDISTEGGALSFGQKVTITSDRTIRTGLGLSPLGASISFAKGVLPSGAGIDLTINPGSNGSIIFADGLGLDGNRFNTFTLEQGGGLTIGGSSSGVFTTGNISILPKIFGSFPKSTVRFDSESGNITLNQGAVLTGLFSGDNNNSDGSNFVAKASLGTLTINGVLDVSGGDNDTSSSGGSGYNSGFIKINAKNVVLNTLQALGGDADSVGNGGAGGQITIGVNSDDPPRGLLESLKVNSILADGGKGAGIVGGIGGDVVINRTSALGEIKIGTISSRGGDSADSFGGSGGNITITAVLGDLDAPTSFFTNGGEGSADAFAGLGGDVTLQATVGNISFQNQSLSLTGDGGITIIAGKSIVFATSADFTTPSNSSGGVVITSNEDALRTDRRGVISLEYGSANTGGELYMPSSAYLISNGGKVAMDVKTTSGSAGAMTLSGISTSATDLNAGSIEINQNPDQDVGIVLGNVTVSGSIDANGGVPASTGPLYGRNGGSVLISGLAVSVQQINTSGSASLATATVPAFGGSGGDVTITGTSILIQAGTVPATGSFAINTSGGTGLGTGNANGGSGGNIQLDGNVTLDSGDASRTTIIFNTQGGAFAAGGVNGIGGNITVTGTLTGTEATSNILDLRYGSGTVTLGDAAADTITLGTLITAADDARSTGNLIINGRLDLGTLTTYARGYSIEINGGGTIANTVTFNNTGNVALGSLTADTTFSNGVDSTAPATSLLKGNIVSGTSANPGQGTPLSFGAATLVGNTTLDSNGSNVSLGTIDGPFNLDFASGIGSGVVDITSAVGASSRVGTITVSPGISQPVLFRSSVTAAGLVGAAGTTISFDGNVDLTGGANLLGLTKLNNTLYADQNTTFSFTSGANSALNDVDLTLGPILINGLGNYSFTGLFTGAQNLTLSGLGSKVFSGTVGSVTTGIGTGTGAAITMSGGDVTFGALTTASGLASTTADVIFNGIATLGAGDTGTTLDSNVILSGATISSAGSVALGNDVGIDTITLDTGTVTLTGSGAYTMNVQMTGGQRLVLGGAGTKTFVSTADVTGFTQDALSGTVTFQDNVSTSGDSLFSASTVLDNINFTSSGVGALGATAMNGVTLNGVVTLQGDGNYVFNGAMTGTALLALASEGTSTFESTVTVNRVYQSVSAGRATFRGDVTTGGVSSLDGATVLDGMVFTAGGVTTMNGVTLSTGAVTLQGAGAYAIGGAVTGDQNMILGGNGAKTFDGTVSVGSALLGITQADAIGNTVRFNNTVTTAGVSTFNRGVTLGTMTFNSGGATTMNDLVTLAGAATLQGAGSYTVNGAVGGGQNLTLAEAGTKAFNSTLNLGTFSQTGGKVSLGGGVTTSGAVNLATVGTTGDILVNSTGATQTYGSVTLAGDLTTATTSGDVDAVTFGPGGVTGAGNLNVQAAALALNGVVANKGLFSAETSGNIDLGGGYLSAIEVARIASTGGARFASLVGDVTAQNLATSTSLSMQALDGETTVNGVSVNGALNMESGGAVNFNGNDTYASSLAFTGQSVSSDGSSGVLANIIVPSLGGITLTGSGNGLSYSPSGNLNVSGRISVNGGDITLDPSGNFVNSYAGNPFSANSTKILTKDLFSSWPANGAVPGLQVVYGVNSIGQVGANQIGVSTTLLAGNAAPYILEFTTGTGQPYIFAQQAAIPPVMLPAALTGGNGFAKTISYSADEIEMMTPEERSAYENQQRQVSARVILQGQSGEGEEIGAPTEGRTPQAAIPAVQIPVAPTAQVLLEGKPLAGAKSDQERGDAKRILKVRPTRAVAVRSGLNVNEVMETERMAAEVSVGSAPVVQSR